MTASTVVLVEGSGVIRAVVRRQLAAAGYQIVEAEDGGQALSRCRRGAPDVVLLAVELADMSGFDVLVALKSDPELADVPVVFLTGHSDPADLVQGLRLGAHDYLRKPFEPAELLARVAAAARTKRLQDELRRHNELLQTMSRTDPLTGLHNRRHVEEQLSAATSLARRNAQPVAVVMVDVDHFKTVNDGHGHPAGDAVLRQVAARLAGSVRAEDTVARWGGEEFLAVLPLTGVTGALATGERMRAAVAAAPCRLADGTSLAVTVSAGAAASHTASAEQLLHWADAALYAAKEAGRDRVVGAAEGTSLVSAPW